MYFRNCPSCRTTQSYNQNVAL